MIKIDQDTKVIVQGITGKQGQYHTKKMLSYGTNIVAGVTPGKGGTEIAGRPVYDRVSKVKEKADWSVLFVPAPHVLKAAEEALTAGLNLVIITEHVPVWDVMKILEIARNKGQTVIGPNGPGLIRPGKCKIGIMPGHVFRPGPVGVVSRSGTLTYECAYQLTRKKIGQDTVIGIGGDMLNGLDFCEVLDAYEKDDDIEAIMLIGEIGGAAEERAAAFIKDNVKKPVAAYLAGQTAPPGKTMGHAGAIINGKTGTAAGKIKALKEAKVEVVEQAEAMIDFFRSVI